MSSRRERLLVVAGEASGDALAAPVLARLKVATFGVGGPALLAQGCRLVQDQRKVAAMGLWDVARRGPALLVLWRRLAAAVQEERPRGALLVGFSEFNARLGPCLRERGIRVLWYAPPQIWAWRSHRARRLARASDALAVLLPFESGVWQPWGVPTYYVGHPALEAEYATPAVARAALGAPLGQRLVALLPGSRSHEIRTHLPCLLESYDLLRRRHPELGGWVLLARGILPSLARWASELAHSKGVSVVSGAVPRLLQAFQLAIAVSGTVTLEAAVAGVPVVIIYRPGPLVSWWARRALLVPWVGLPNLVLRDAVFPEIVGQAVSPALVAERADEVLADPQSLLAACQQVRSALARDLDQPPSSRVAQLLAPWLA